MNNDLFYRLKTEENIPLIAEIRTLSETEDKNKPVVSYDKFGLFAQPFLTLEEDPTSELFTSDPSAFRINFPFSQSAVDPLVSYFLFLFLIKGMVIDVCTFSLPLDKAARSKFVKQHFWYWASGPFLAGRPAPYGWATTAREATENLSVQIYG
jgi:hypothetical protein